MHPCAQPTVKPPNFDIPAWACRRTLALGVSAHAALYPAVPMRLLTQEDLVPPRKDILQVGGVMNACAMQVWGGSRACVPYTFRLQQGLRELKQAGE